MTEPVIFQAPPAPAQPSPQPTPAAAPATPASPPWGEDFDADKAWKLIENLRAQKNDPVAERELKTLRDKAAQWDQLEQASKTELERKTEELSRWQTEAEKWRTTSVASTVKALAAADFADPDDAVRNIDPAKYLGAGGEIDEEAIQSDLAALLEAKPHYRRTAETTTRVPAPNPAQGSGNGRPSGDPGAEFAGILGGLLAR